MSPKQLFLRLLVAACASTAMSAHSANAYYVVVPVEGAKAPPGLAVTLSGFELPTALVGVPYAGIDFNSLLTVTGDAKFSGYGVKWSVVEGRLPAGLSVTSDGRLAGIPAEAGNMDFKLRATYKTKTGLQAYQLVSAGAMPAQAGTLAPITSTQFDAVAVGAFSELHLNFTNTGTDVIRSYTVASTSAEMYEGGLMLSQSCLRAIRLNGGIPPGATCVMRIGFVPKSTGVKVGTITVKTPENELASLQLTGRAGTGAPSFSENTVGGLNFGIGTANVPRTRSFSITNNGDARIDINVSTSNSTAGYEWTAASTCGRSLEPGATCSISVTLTFYFGTKAELPFTVNTLGVNYSIPLISE